MTLNNLLSALLHFWSQSDLYWIEKRLKIYCKNLIFQKAIQDLYRNENEKYWNRTDILKELSGMKLESYNGKPNTVELARTIRDWNEAIEAYKNEIEETIQVLSQFNFLEL